MLTDYIIYINSNSYIYNAKILMNLTRSGFMSKIKKCKDPVSALTHFIALIMIIPSCSFLIYRASVEATVWHIVSFSVFTAGLILLYSASTIYHAVNINDKVSDILKRIDHMMIFVLIAASYTPVCLVSIRGGWGWTLLGIIWFCAISGIVLKAVWIDAPRWLSTVIYVLMGWMALIAVYPIFKAVPVKGFFMLIAGGIIYTVGAVIYGTKRPYINFKFFGFHELFHLFVMGGSFFHILFMFKYVLI